MKFKLDENFGARTYDIFQKAGHDVHTVRQESLQGASDQSVYDVCCDERRCLVTLDLNFSDVTRFPPGRCGGIAVIRVPQNPGLPLLEKMVRQFLGALERLSVEGELWIVEIGRIRVHQRSDD